MTLSFMWAYHSIFQWTPSKHPVVGVLACCYPAWTLGQLSFLALYIIVPSYVFVICINCFSHMSKKVSMHGMLNCILDEVEISFDLLSLGINNCRFSIVYIDARWSELGTITAKTNGGYDCWTVDDMLLLWYISNSVSLYVLLESNYPKILTIHR